MEAVSIHLKDNLGISRAGEAFQLGIPLAKGALAPDTPVTLVDPQTSTGIPCQSSPMAHWPDGSIRWLKLQFIGDLVPKQRRTLELRRGGTQPTTPSALSYHEDSNGIAIDTGAARFHLRSKIPAWEHIGDGEPICQQLSLSAADGALCNAVENSDWTIVEHGEVSLSCELQGWFLAGDVRLVRFRCQLTFYRHSKTVEVQTCIHNPKRARHPGGLWDLGDPGSIHFSALAIRAAVPDIRQINAVLEPGSPSMELDHSSCLLYQDSSGGENWDSLNHVNANGEVTTRFRGYRLYANNRTWATGNRATPVITVTNPKLTVQASLPRFWQNFPSSMGVQDNQLVIGLFPEEAAEPYELQGGERKTQTAYFHYGDEPDALAWTLFPVVPTLDARQYEVSQAFPWFNSDAARGPLDDLIQLGLDGPSNFFAKREIIDEYGWRNFGEIFADHETLYQKADEPPLISHYNNQYDAIYGFARQFALSGDVRWHELMDDLAAHVRDIDIYHTDEDRSEYNNGLFWHTDHYLPAHTATHRTFSKHSGTSSNPGQTGGGPAEQHCYTTGLLYHYFLTGSLASREAVLALANWIVVQREGDQSLLGQLDLAKRRELPRLKAALKGQNPPDRQYAFNRGTGNYINTLIDAYWLTLELDWLKRAEQVIRGTVHPSDDLKERNLFDTENSWSYLIFLSSLTRYAKVKLVFEQFDDELSYSLACLKLYFNWICNNEVPFLDQPSKLEFPNDTWTAQDVRKAMLLFQGADLFSNKAEEFHQSGERWLNYVTHRLLTSEEHDFARIQVTLLQNAGPHSVGKPTALNEKEVAQNYNDLNKWHLHEQPRLGRRKASLKLLQRLLLGLRNLSLTKEKTWLSTRLESR